MVCVWGGDGSSQAKCEVWASEAVMCVYEGEAWEEERERLQQCLLRKKAGTSAE